MSKWQPCERDALCPYGLSVCLSARITLKPHGRTSPNFCACCLCPWVGPPLTALGYVMYFWFYRWRHASMSSFHCSAGSTVYSKPVSTVQVHRLHRWTIRPHRKRYVHRCGLLLQISHVAWTVCFRGITVNCAKTDERQVSRLGFRSGCTNLS